jgi:DNA-binding protein YbaB
MMRNMAGMMKKVQEMQSRMEELQAEMATTEFSATVGGGSVSVTVTGKGEMRAVKIDPASCRCRRYRHAGRHDLSCRQ